MRSFFGLKFFVLVSVFCGSLSVFAVPFFEDDSTFQQCYDEGLHYYDSYSYYAEPYSTTGYGAQVINGKTIQYPVSTWISFMYYRQSDNQPMLSGHGCEHLLPGSGPFGDPSFSKAPVATRGAKKECPAKGSVIYPSKKTVSETVPIHNTDFDLVYSSEFNSQTNRNRSMFRTYSMPSEQTVPHKISILDPQDNLIHEDTFPFLSTLDYKWTWDGVTGNISNNIYISKIDIVVKLTNRFQISGINSEIIVPRTETRETITVYHPEIWGLKGWTISAHHYFDSDSRILFHGSGQKIQYEGYKTASVSPYGNVILVPNKDADDEIYIFDTNGKHLETRTGITSAVKYKFNYDSTSRLTSIDDINGKSTTFNYDSSGNILSITATYGQQTSFATTSTQISNVQIPTGVNYSMTYDSKSLLATFTKPNLEVTTFTYDTDGNFQREDKNTGLYQQFSTSISGVNTLIQHLVGWGTKLKTLITEDPDYELATYKDHNDNVLATRKDKVNGYVEQSDIDGSSNLQYVAHPFWGNDVKFLNSGSQSVVDGSSTISSTFQSYKQYNYNNPSDPFSLSNIYYPLVESTQANSSYSVISVPMSAVTIQTKDGRVSYTYFNNKEQITRIEPAATYPVDFSYDTDGRLSEISKGTSVATFGYGSDGLINSITNFKSQTTGFSRNAIGQITTKTLPNSETIGFEYTNGGALKKITTPSNQVHNFTYGTGDYLQSYLSADGKLTSYTRDSEKRLTKITKPSLHELNISYKAQSDFVESIGTTLGTYYFNSIDSKGKPHQVISADNITTNISWVAGQVKEQKWFDSNGSVIATLTNNFASNAVRIESIALNGQNFVTYEYSPNSGKISAINNNTYAYAFDGYSYFSDRLTVYHPSSGLSVEYEDRDLSSGTVQEKSLKFNYFNSSNAYSSAILKSKFDRLGNATEMFTSKKNESTGLVQSTDTLIPTYDSLNRLTQVQKDKEELVGGNLVASTEYFNKYNFPSNSNGNLNQYAQSLTVSGSLTKNTAATYGADDQLLTLSGTMNRTYTYDVDGNLSTMTDSSGTTTYIYDDFSNLKKITFPSGKIVEYKVDGFNRRVKKLVNGVVTEYYIWYDQIHLAAVLDSSKVPQIVFMYGPESNSPAYVLKGGVTYRVIADPALGSIRFLVNTADLTVAQEISYDEFGNVVSDSNPGFQPLGFAGGLGDVDSGLVRFWARDYDSSVGRFTTKDPIGFSGGYTNLYTYVGGTPMSLTDPTGNCPWCIGAVVGGVASGISAYLAGGDAKAIAIAAGIGAVSGGLTAGVSTLSALGAFGLNSGAGAVTNVATQLAMGTDLTGIDTSSVLVSAFAGGIGGVAGLGAGNIAFFRTPVLGNAIGMSVANTRALVTSTLVGAGVGTGVESGALLCK